MIDALKSGDKKIAVVGLGYVGLPIALELAKKMEVIGFDIKQDLIQSLKAGKDPNKEVDDFTVSDFRLQFTDDADDLKDIGVFIVAVPTPVTKLKSPDLRPLLAASKTIGQKLEKGAVVIYESTVYPGCTEEDCLPVLERNSQLKYGEDFFIGYSPERINPGDKVHTLTNTIKIVSGDTPETLDFIAKLYEEVVVDAGVFRAANIKVAEAAKIIENTQRDLNIALMNELSIIFDLMKINTHDVIEAAGTKWNFNKFYPGLVGGHCIGVDPYYLTYKAEKLGYKPEIILSGRKVNDNLSRHVVNRVLDHFDQHNKIHNESSVLVLGITFKENVSDIRNSKVVDVVQELQHYNVKVDIYDPQVDQMELKNNYELSTIDSLKDTYDCIIAAVSHEEFKNMTESDIEKYAKDNCILVDIKSMYKDKIERLHYWSL